MATYTKQDIAKVLETSTRTISEDNQYLTKNKYINPIQVSGEANQYSEQDLEVFRQLRDHCQAGYARKSFVPIKKTEIITARDSNSRLISSKQRILPVENFRQVFTIHCQSDPLFDYSLLQRCVDNRWYLPTAKLAVIINKKPATFCHVKIFLHQGFIFTRLPQKQSKSYIWSVDNDQKQCPASEKHY